MSSKENALRAFGMSAAQIMSEMREHERSYSISLMPSIVDSTRKIAGYEQFEFDVRSSAASMSEYYEVFYCLEVSIRRLVSAMLIEAEGKDWWASVRVEEGLRNEVRIIQKKENDSGITPRSENNLDFLTFGQLGQLITSNFDLFETVLTSKGAVSRVMNQLNLLRNPIAHCCELSPDEADRLRLSVRDWFRLFN